MGCDRAVIASTKSQDGKTTVTWLTYTMTGLDGFLITLVQGGTPTSFDAKATDTTITVSYTAAADCKATVTPKTAEGPSNDNASFAAPVPFPPAPIDPNAGRPIIFRACADAASVTANWVPAVLEDPVLGYYLSVVQNSVKLTNFDIEGGEVVVATVDYTLEVGSTYEVIITPYDAFGPAYDKASYPEPIPYP